ncbi:MULTISPECIES: hypothetical protein [unclassified Streptomyces]|uniref:hypothetical protein n=1 Tax=unclassified Streptomyces TaxID=2593676 RepID=UPI0033AD9562
MPRIRPGRVRTKRHNRRPALQLSTIDPQDFNLRSGETKSIVCPDCRTWRRLMGETKLKIREHTISAGRGKPLVHCDGSNQVVEVDIDVRAWQRRADQLLRDGMWPDQRHAPRQHYKPIPAPAPALTQIAAGLAGTEAGDSRSPWLLREIRWVSTAPTVRETDARRTQLPDGDAPLQNPPVPLTTLHPQRPAR